MVKNLTPETKQIPWPQYMNPFAKGFGNQVSTGISEKEGFRGALQKYVTYVAATILTLSVVGIPAAYALVRWSFTPKKGYVDESTGKTAVVASRALVGTEKEKEYAYLRNRVLEDQSRVSTYYNYPERYVQELETGWGEDWPDVNRTSINVDSMDKLKRKMQKAISGLENRIYYILVGGGQTTDSIQRQLELEKVFIEIRLEKLISKLDTLQHPSDKKRG